MIIEYIFYRIQLPVIFFKKSIYYFKPSFTRRDTMGVQKDAGELLLFFYDELIKHGKTLVKTPDVLEATKWDKNRIIAAYTYLKQLSLLKSFLSRKEGEDLDITKNFYVRGLFPKAVNIVENEVNFEKTFGFKANLASLKFSWST